ncbi:hypothetical protein SALBM311S_01560 [Streptomyces alboniger]
MAVGSGCALLFREQLADLGMPRDLDPRHGGLASPDPGPAWNASLVAAGVRRLAQGVDHLLGSRRSIRRETSSAFSVSGIDSATCPIWRSRKENLFDMRMT